MSLYTKSCNPRLIWKGAAHGWWLEVPTTLTASQLARVVEWSMKRQIDRWRALPAGDRRDDLECAIHALKAGRIQQRLVDHDGDGVVTPFAATERTGTRVTSFPRA